MTHRKAGPIANKRDSFHVGCHDLEDHDLAAKAESYIEGCAFPFLKERRIPPVQLAELVQIRSTLMRVVSRRGFYRTVYFNSGWAHYKRPG